MRRRRCSITTLVGIVSAVLLAPARAQARTACASETTTPTRANEANVSDAMFCITNQVRATYGLAALRREARLNAAASGHSGDMANRNYFSHTSPEGQTPWDRARAQGYTFASAENIAAGYGNARMVIIGWMNSEGHCRGILSAARDVGLGTAVSSSSQYSSYYTQLFGDSSTIGSIRRPRTAART